MLLRSSVPAWVEVEPDMSMLLDPSDLVQANIIFAGAWEPQTWQALREHITAGGVFVDVGAHVGYFSLKAAKIVGLNGRVLAIEPNPDTLKTLRANIQANGDRVITVKPVACSDRDGTVEIHSAARTNSGGSSLSPENAGPLASPYRVAARRLDDIVQESGVSRVEVMKIDVEGAELLVLKGAQQTLDRHHPVVIVEMMDRLLKNMGASAAEVVAFFEQHGYAPRHAYGTENHNTEFVYTRAF